MNARAALYIARQNLEQAKTQESALQAQLDKIDADIQTNENELAEIEKWVSLTIVGGGAVIGGVIGGILTKGGGGVGKGTAEGTKIGADAAEAIIIALKAEIALLQQQRRSISEEIKNLKEKIAELNNIVEQAVEEFKNALNALTVCESRHRYPN